MWIVRWILGAIIIIFVLGFALQNQTETATIQLLNWQSPVLPLYLYLYFAFGTGLIFWALVSAFNIFKLRGRIGKVEKENKKLHKELDRLRNAAIEEEAPSPQVQLPAMPETEA